MKPKLQYIDFLCGKKNLLGFSGGSDSVALFFMLIQEGIDFDIAIVDYGVRDQSKQEIAYAKELAKAYNKQCFCASAPQFSKNFEANARKFRYAFFQEIVEKMHYENLVLAHHFNDRFEWFLMQLSKGSGLNNLLGFDGTEKRDSFHIVRPLLWVSKDEILEFCKSNDYKFFEDESNLDTRILRNFMRHNFANLYIKHFKNGLQRSFAILSSEKEAFYTHNITHFGDFLVFKYQEGIKGENLNLHCIDIALKRLGYVLSIKQRQEIIKAQFSCEIGAKSKKHRLDSENLQDSLKDFAQDFPQGFIIQRMQNHIIICRAKPCVKLPKDFKEFARIKHIPPRLRNVFYHHIKTHNLTYTQFLDSLPF